MFSSNSVASRNSWWAQALHNRLIAMVLAMIVIVPLVAVPADSGLPGLATLTFQGFALLLAATLLWRSRWDFSREGIVSFLRTGANLPVLLLMALAVASCAFAPNKAFAIQKTLELGTGVLLYFIAAYHFRQSKHLSMLVDTLLFLAFSVSLLAVGQYAMNSDVRGTALFGNQQLLGSLLMLLLPIVAVVAVTDKNATRQLVAQGITVLTGGGLLLAQTRSAWMGAVAALVVLGALALFANREKNVSSQRKLATQKHKFVMPAMLAVISVGFFLAIASQNGSILDRAATLSNATGDKSFNQRVNLWQGALTMIQERPLTGWGVGLYPVEQYQFTGAGAPFAAIGMPVSLAEQAHNFYLQMGAELGIPGLLLFGAVLVSFFVAAVRRVDQMDAGIRRTLLIGSVAAVVAFAVDALSSPSWQFGQVSMFLWLLMGAGVSCLRPRAKHEEEAPVVWSAPVFVRPVAAVAAVLVLSIAVMPTLSIAAPLPAGYSFTRVSKHTGTAEKIFYFTVIGGVLYIFDAYLEKLREADKKETKIFNKSQNVKPPKPPRS